MINQLNLSDLETRVTNEEPKPVQSPVPVVVWTLPLGARTCNKCGHAMERRNTYYPPREAGQPVALHGYVTLSCCTNPECDHREAN